MDPGPDTMSDEQSSGVAVLAVVADDAPTRPVLSIGGLAVNETLCAPIDGAPGMGLVIDALDAVAESSKDDNWLPPPPDLPREIAVDPDNRVAESDETNNVTVIMPPSYPPLPTCTPDVTPTATVPVVPRWRLFAPKVGR